ncbi:neutral protease 2-like protein [Moniliophthora roreri MCA 2997]|uniref:deuterolysin n=1 Tax=Moniliophthora roreri (strain MCA 2997) TaxID=1381753 RepID=V2Y927_MONRO|nr:neutral protease 2-like protein [Moniliophthora roreri MCA 2997]
MFRSSFLLLSVLAKIVLSLSVGDLDVSLKVVSASVQSVNDIVVTAIVSNPTSSDLRVLTVNNVLDTSATRSFDITADGKEVPFAGIKATFDFLHESLYLNVPAGKSIALNHTVSSVYDFSSFAPGTKFTISPRGESTIHESVDDAAPLKVESNTVEVTVESDLAFNHLFTPVESDDLERRVSTPRCSDGSKLQLLVDSLKYARSIAGGAATDIRSHPTGPEYTRFFGGNNQNDIWYNFDRVAGDQNTNRDITCSSDNADARNYCSSNPGVIAYTVIYSDGRTPIFTCDLFVQAGTTPSICQGDFDSTMSSRGGIILHELAHAVHGADDVTYGCSAAAGLSVADKKRNADNYRCMGLNIYKDYNCIYGPL